MQAFLVRCAVLPERQPIRYAAAVAENLEAAIAAVTALFPGTEVEFSGATLSVETTDALGLKPGMARLL